MSTNKIIDLPRLTRFWGKIKNYVDTALSSKADTSSLASVATSGSYRDLSNKPSIPTVDSSLNTSSTNAIQNRAVATALDNKTDKTYCNTYTLKSSTPIYLYGIGVYASMLVLGFVQGIGSVALLVTITNSSTSVVNITNGASFSNSDLTFAYNPNNKVFVITSAQSGESILTILKANSN